MELQKDTRGRTKRNHENLQTWADQDGLLASAGVTIEIRDAQEWIGNVKQKGLFEVRDKLTDANGRTVAAHYGGSLTFDQAWTYLSGLHRGIEFNQSPRSLR